MLNSKDFIAHWESSSRTSNWRRGNVWDYLCAHNSILQPCSMHTFAHAKEFLKNLENWARYNIILQLDFSSEKLAKWSSLIGP